MKSTKRHFFLPNVIILGFVGTSANLTEDGELVLDLTHGAPVRDASQGDGDA